MARPLNFVSVNAPHFGYLMADGSTETQIAQQVVNPYAKLVSKYANLAKPAARRQPIVPSTRRVKLNPHAPTALIFSPHPDDECIVGGLALRLARECGWNVQNTAVTLGSNKQRRKGRLTELRNACRQLRFDLVIAGNQGLENVNLVTRDRHRRQWAENISAIVAVIKQTQPRVIFAPHDDDGHTTHIGTHHLVIDALKAMPARFRCHVVETEFWRQMRKPNLLVELKPKDVADLMAALSLHVGEVRRNPYHLTLPAWLMDNVRRAEIVAGHGSASPDFTFGIHHRVCQWKNGRLVEVQMARRFLSRSANPELSFQ